MSMKMTVLEMVQSVLAAMDSDAVDHIGDTIESEQIALKVREVYYDILTYQDIPQFQQLIQLEGMNDPAKRTIMRIPDNCTDIADVRYLEVKNGREIMRCIRPVDKTTFYKEQWDLDNSKPTVEFNVLDDNIRIPYYNDRAPSCYTTFDDEHLVFDSIDLSVDSTLHNDASSAIGYIVPEFRLEDHFVPDLPEKMFPQYLHQLKETCFVEQKQMNNPVEREKRQRSEHRNRHFNSIQDGLDNGQKPQSGRGRRSRYNFNS